MGDNEAIHDSHTKAAERERDEARAELSACQEELARLEVRYDAELAKARAALSSEATKGEQP